MRTIKLEDDYQFVSLKELPLSDGEIADISAALNHFPKFSFDFRYHLDVAGRIFLMTYFKQEKTFYLSSSCLFYELNLLKFGANQEVQAFVDRVTSVSKILKATEYNQAVYQLTDFDELKELEESVLKEVELLAFKMQKYQKSFFEKLSDYFLGLTANFSLIRNNLLKFLVILPWLDFDHSGSEVKKVLLENLRRLLEANLQAEKKKKTGYDRKLPSFLKKSFGLVKMIITILPAKWVGLLARYLVRTMAKRFIAGSDIKRASQTLKQIRKTGRSATLDQLGELVVSSDEADEYLLKVLEVIQGLKKHIKKGKRNGADIPEAHVSIKVTALAFDLRPEDLDYTYAQIAPRLRKILIKAKEEEVFVNIDAEHYHTRDLIFAIYKKVLLETKELHGYQDTGIVVQAYLKDSPEHLKEITTLAKSRNCVMPIRLVKGAYFDAETIEAQAHHFPAPQFLNKEETDLNFRQLGIEIIKEPSLSLALASHNLFDHLFCEEYRKNFYPDSNKIEHQCLHMTYEALSVTLAAEGFAVRNYMPIGNLIMGMAYLVRRIIENSSQVGVLTIMRSHQKAGQFKKTKADWEKKNFKTEHFYRFDSHFQGVSPFRPYLKNHLDKMTFKSPLFEKGDQVIVSPNNKNHLVGKIDFVNAQKAQEQLEQMAASKEALPWRENHLERFKKLLALGSLMLSKRLELAALIVQEAGKTLSEALADVDEAIDFVHFYTQEADSLFKKRNWEAKGIVNVIAPWNFPLAIPCGMVVAALATGNQVVLKSSEKTPLTSEMLARLLLKVGISQEIFMHLPGEGAKIGSTLLNHLNVAMTVFTGSVPTGRKIYQTFYQHFFKAHDGHQYPRDLIAEMGGKNAIIITRTADLDEAISAILASAFAHAGQKCSACSRILVDQKIKEKFLKRFIKATHDLKVGPATDLATFINPVITEYDKERLIKIKKECIQEVNEYKGKVHFAPNDEPQDSYNVKPAIFELPMIRALNNDSWMQKEIFGPIVHICSFSTLEEALTLANSTPYALTGGIFSGSQDEIDFLSFNLRVGNIYINRSNTGARVGIEPFGGFKMSGTGPKAGGVNYLRKFVFESRNYEVDLEEETLKTDFGSDYLYQIPHSSSLGPQKRLNKVIKITKALIQNQSLVLGDYDTKKSQELEELIKWFKKDFLGQYLDKEDNVAIPGQISFNQYDLPGGPVCFLLDQEVPSMMSLIHFLICLSLGDGIVLLCTNNKSYQSWLNIFSYAKEAGISNFNLDVYHISKEILDLALRDPHFEYYYLDSSLKKIEYYQKEIATHHPLTKYFPKIYHQYQTRSFKHILKAYSYSRSYAINIMRHGAPLE